LARQQQLKLDLSAAERDLDLFQTELRRAGNRYASAQYAEAWDAPAIRSKMLDAGAALIEYALGERESYALALPDAGVTSAVLPARKEIERRVEGYRKLLSERASALTVAQSMARLDAEGRNLYRMLVAPLEAALEGKKRIVIVPDGGLVYLPF